MTYYTTVKVEAVLWTGDVANLKELIVAAGMDATAVIRSIADENSDGLYEVMFEYATGKMAGCTVKVIPGEYFICDSVGNVYTLSAKKFEEKNYKEIE